MLKFEFLLPENLYPQFARSPFVKLVNFKEALESIGKHSNSRNKVILNTREKKKSKYRGNKVIEVEEEQLRRKEKDRLSLFYCSWKVQGPIMIQTSLYFLLRPFVRSSCEDFSTRERFFCRSKSLYQQVTFPYLFKLFSSRCQYSFIAT